MYTVKKDRRYIIVEKPTRDTPPELRKLSKSKMGSSLKFKERASCPWDETRQKYDTGLDVTSLEFVGKPQDEINKILEDRKPLIDYLKGLLDRSGKTENEFLSEYWLEVSNNKIIDTSNIDEYLRLYLAMRGRSITPEKEKGNVAKYQSSMYMLIDSKESFNAKIQLKEKKMKVEKWFYSNYDSNTEEVLDILRFENILGLDQVKPEAVLKDTLQRKIEDIDALENILYTIEKVPYEDVVLTNNVRKKIRKGVVRKDKNRYFFDGVELGNDIKSVVKYLKNPENIEVSSKLFD